ncbi:hypothetical protein Syun_028848 [Stephania yunnanensis]|uniref:glutathione transferase n=1 Tax=Stephania yunnanensis TaxID=152371 RepID=A0AAP0ECI8_9MAGN
MALKLYGVSFSTCTASAFGALYEKGVDFEFVPVNLSVGEHKQPEFLAKNPFGVIPVLEDDGVNFFESRAINHYVAHKYKDQGTDLIRHKNVKEAGLVGVWVEVESQTFNPAISPIIYQLYVNPLHGETADHSVVEAAVEKLGKVLDVYEAHLATSKYLAGDFFSMADVNHFAYTNYLMKTPHATVVNSRPHVKAWWEDISSRPALKKVADGMTLSV